MTKRVGAALLVALMITPGAVWAKEAFRFAVLGDSRSEMNGASCKDYNHGVSSLLGTIVENIRARSASGPISLVLFSGDMTSGYYPRDASSVAECNKVQLEHWRNTMQPLLDSNMRIRVTAGNHDAAAGDPAAASRCGLHGRPYRSDPSVFSSLAEVLRDMVDSTNPGPASDQGLTYSFDQSGCHFAVLNAYTMTQNNSFSNETIQWLNQDLKQARERGLKLFVLSHPPAFPGGGHLWDSLPFYDPSYRCDDYSGIDRRPERDRFWNILKKHGVIAYFSGHEHNIQVQKVEGVWHVVSGGLTEKVYPLNGAPSDIKRNRILYNGEFQNPRATELWPWIEHPVSFWGWCLVKVEENKVTMKVIGSEKRPHGSEDLKELKSFVLWEVATGR